MTIWRINRYFGFRQSLWLVVSSIIASLIIRKPIFLKYGRKYKYLLLLSGLGLIILTFIFGTYPGGNGPKLWLGIQNIYFQPSELLKLLLIIYLSAYFSDVNAIESKLKNKILPTIILALSATTLLILQRDLGTALIFIAVYVLMLFIVLEKKRSLLFSFLLFVLSGVIGFYTIDLIRIRFEAWVFPWGNPQTGSYQIIQSLIAVAAGGIFGSGIGLGYPNLVPLSHSDFIFSAIAEELGLIGSLGFLCLLAIILFRGLSISINARTQYHRYLAIGITSYILTQSILIIGGNIRLLPITGVTLPFVSYGGSSLLVSFISFAILILVENKSTNTRKVNLNPYRITAALFSICLIAIALTLGWWGIIHTHNIQYREDNARNRIANLYVKRGDILDRNNEILAESTGSPGEFERIYVYPSLSNTIGFFHQNFGLSGIEAAYDDYLRGIKGYPAQDIWFSYLLYDQPPEGRAVRLTIDSDIQQKSDQLLGEHTGGMAVINAENGEILAVSTSPFFDANKLDENWESWQDDDSAPILNRATQGAYPLGGIINPLLIAQNIESLSFQGTPTTASTLDNIDRSCDLSANEDDVISETLRYGCLATTLKIVEDESPHAYFSSEPVVRIFHPQSISIVDVMPNDLNPKTTWDDLLFGKGKLRSSPLLIGYVFLPFSNDGVYQDLSIVSAINTASSGWVVVTKPEPKQVIAPDDVNEIRTLLESDSAISWEISALTEDENDTYALFVTGTTSEDRSNRYIVSLALEGSTREEAINIGREMLAYFVE